MKKKSIADKFEFKREVTIFGEVSIYYMVVGVNFIIRHDVTDEEVHIIEYKIIEGDDEFKVTYSEAEFFEAFGGYHMGTDDVSIEDLIKFEYTTILDRSSDIQVPKGMMKAFDTPVSYADIANTNFN